MNRFVEGVDRCQSTLFPESLEDWVGESDPVRVIAAFVEALGLSELGFGGVDPKATGRPSYHPSVLLNLYTYPASRSPFQSRLCPAGERLVYRFTGEDQGLIKRRYWTNACEGCAIKDRCTTGKERRITRWQHEHVLEAVRKRLDENPPGDGGKGSSFRLPATRSKARHKTISRS